MIRVALDRLFDRINLDTQDPNQTCWHQKPTRRHVNPKQASHVTNGIIFCVSTSAISVPSIVLKRCRKEHGEERVTAKSKLMMMNLVSRYRVRDPNVLASTAPESPGNTKSESQEVPLNSLNVQKQKRWDPQCWLAHQTPQNGTMTTSGLLKCGNLLRRRIEPFCKKLFIPEQSEWPIAKDSEPFSRKFNARHWHTFYDLVNVYVFDSGSICIHGKELLRQFAFHDKYWRRSHFKADVRDIWTVDIGTIRWDLWSVSNQLGKFSMETVGRIQNFGHNRQKTDGIRVEYFHRIHYIGACPWSPKVHKRNGRTRTIPRTNHLHVDVQWHHIGI